VYLILFTIGGLMVAFSIQGYTLVKSPENAVLHPLSNVVTRATGAWLLSHIQHNV